MNIEQLCDLAERYGNSVITKQEFISAVEQYSSALLQQIPCTDVPIDGEGQRLHEGDTVYTYDAFTANTKRIYGTLHKNLEYPEVSEWYVDYYDGNQCAVLDLGMIWKA